MARTDRSKGKASLPGAGQMPELSEARLPQRASNTDGPTPEGTRRIQLNRAGLQTPSAILKADFVRCHYTTAHLRRLLPAPSDFGRELGFPAKNQSALDAIAESFRYPGKGRATVGLQLELFTEPTLEKKGSTHVSVVGSLYERKNGETPIGFFCRELTLLESGSVHCHNAGFYINQTTGKFPGLAQSANDFLKSEILIPTGVETVSLKADFVGRYVWPRYGYDFQKSYWYRDPANPGQSLKTWEMAAQNLERFLKLQCAFALPLTTGHDGSESIFQLNRAHQCLSFAD